MKHRFGFHSSLFLSAAFSFLSATTSAQTHNTATGVSALGSNTTGDYNTATGYRALGANTTGTGNSAEGRGALYSNVSGNYNTAIGVSALYYNEVSENTAVGASALESNTIGDRNTACGTNALYAATTGEDNTALGHAAMQQAEGFFNSSNTAVGAHALYSNQEEANVAVGAFALTDNAFGSANTATGYYALSSNADGSNNVAAGFEALKLSLGSDNTALGYRAISNGTSGARNTGVGVTTLKKVIKGVDNSALGSNAGPSGDFSNTTALGAGATPTQSNQVRVGNSNTTVIGGQVSWSTTSDARFKTHVKDDVPGLAFIKKLRPVTFDWDQAKLDAFYGNAASNPASDRKPSRRYTGFLAQQVEEAAKACEFDFSGVKKPESESSPYELSYADFVVPLVKTVQEQQQQIERLNAIVAKLEARSGPAMSMGLTGGLAPWALISSCLLAAGLAAHLRWRRRRAA